MTIAPSLKTRTCGSWSALYCLCAVAHELWLAYTKRAFGQSAFRRSTSGRAWMSKERRGVKGVAVRCERSSGREPTPPFGTTFNTRTFRLTRPAPRAAKEHDVHARLGHHACELLRTRGHRPRSSIRSPPSHAHKAGRDRHDREPTCRAGAEGERGRQKDQCHGSFDRLLSGNNYVTGRRALSLTSHGLLVCACRTPVSSLSGAAGGA